MTENQRLGPPPIEPLSDVAWARVERAVWSELDAQGAVQRTPPPSPRRWWLVAAPLFAAAAAAVIVLAVRWPFESMTTRLVLPAGASVMLDDSHIQVVELSALVMSQEADHPFVLVERGDVRFTVPPRRERAAFIVRAGDATIRVVGTRFQVARSEERISVAVEHGLVNVEFRGGTVPVGAGQHWTSEAPARIAVSAPRPGVAPPAPEPEIEMPDAADAPSPAPPAKGSGHRSKRPASSADPRIEPKLGAEPKVGTEPAEMSDDDRDRIEYDRLAALEPKAPDTALKGYMALGRGTSRWAAPALYAAARLAVDRRDPRAETFLSIYLQRFPDGANAADARKLLARLKPQ